MTKVRGLRRDFVQFAKQKGATVYTTAAAARLEYVQSLQADYVIDSNIAITAQVNQSIDFIFDCVGGDFFHQSLPLLNQKKGRVISITEYLDPKETVKQGFNGEFLFVSPNGAQLTHIAHLLESKQLQPFPISIHSLSEANDVLKQMQTTRSTGKHVLKIKG